jgi:Arc/MetJ-type ribon-helix-helix transcriptional regulator
MQITLIPLVAHPVLHSPTMPSRVIRARLDEPSEAALATLMREGRNESEAIRAALVEAGERRVRRSTLTAEVGRLATDPADTAERDAVRAAFATLEPEWPA